MEALKANEIMIGDWMFVYDVEHLRPMQIGTIKNRSGNFWAELSSQNGLGIEHCECKLSKLVPIEINERVLERSGFQLGTGRFCSILDWIWRDTRANVTVIVTHKPLDLPRRVTINAYTQDEDEHTIIDTPIQYVHELQHLLSFCGVSLELKVRRI